MDRKRFTQKVAMDCGELISGGRAGRDKRFARNIILT